MCEEIPVGHRDAPAIPVEERGGHKCLIEDLWPGGGQPASAGQQEYTTFTASLLRTSL